MGFANSKLPPKDLSELQEETEFTVQELENWYGDFRTDNKDGLINLDQYMLLYNKHYPNGDAAIFSANTFRVFDSNCDGFIDFREFIVALSVASRGSNEEKLKWLFSLYDMDCNGVVSKEEILVVMKSLHKMTHHSFDGTRTAIKAEQHIDEIFSRADGDGDGSLTMEEFFKLAMSDPKLSKIFMYVKGSES